MTTLKWLPLPCPCPQARTRHANNRIGKGPWYNAKGEKVADEVASLHRDKE